MILACVVLAHYRRVTDRWKDISTISDTCTSLLIDSILRLMYFWTIRGKIIRTVVAVT